MSRSNRGRSSKYVSDRKARVKSHPSDGSLETRFANVCSIIRRKNASAMALFCLFIVCISAPALADNAIQAETGIAAKAPAAVNYCSAGSYGIPGILVFQADFVGWSMAPLTAVKLRFDLYDAFGTYLAGLETTRTGTFAPGAVIQTSGRDPDGNPIGWKIRNRWPDTRRVICSIAKTAASDGSIWANATLPSPPPSPLP